MSTTPAATPSPAPAPSPPRGVTSNTPCRGCSYDLMGVPVDGVCPECGLAVAHTLRGLATPPHFGPAMKLYLWLSGVFVTCLLLANILGVKLFHFDLSFAGWDIPVEHTVGMLTFPITFLLTDLLNEYYGNKAARRVAYLGFAMGLLAFALIWIARQIPILEGIPGTANHPAFENIFGSASLMYLASMVAFLFGSILDIALFTVFKRWTGGKMVWFRATGSTIVSQLFDSFIVTFMFFWFFPTILGNDAAPLLFCVKTALTGYVLKFVISVLLTPGIYLGRWMIREWVGLQPLPAEHKA